jgi:hypothetical protein
MNKLTLEPESLNVEAFETAAADVQRRGLEAGALPTNNPLYGCTRYCPED